MPRERLWIMTVALPRDHKVAFFGSTDLKHWKQRGEFGPAGAAGGLWECPDLFELPVDGDPERTRWVLKVGLNPGHVAGGSGEQYFVGRFDGSTFRNDNPPGLTLWTDYGPDCYCGLTWNDAPGGPVMLGWMNNWLYARFLPTRPWRGQMTLPRKLALASLPEGLRLVQRPVGALQALRDEPVDAGAETGGTFELEARVQVGQAAELGWKLLAGDAQETVVGYDARAEQIFLDRRRSGQGAFSTLFQRRYRARLPLVNGELKLRVFVDRSSVEVFAGDGRVVLTALVFPDPGSTSWEFYSTGGKPGPVKTRVWRLKSIWR